MQERFSKQSQVGWHCRWPAFSFARRGVVGKQLNFSRAKIAFGQVPSD